MKTLSYIPIIIAIVATMLFGSCTIETSDNGKLDGFWHLTKIEFMNTGETLDYSQKYRYWGVSFDLIRLQDLPENEAGIFFLRFDYNGNTLRVYEPRSGASGASAGETVDTLLTSPLPLMEYGISSLDETFTIEKLNSSSMILSTNSYRLKFKRM